MPHSASVFSSASPLSLKVSSICSAGMLVSLAIRVFTLKMVSLELTPFSVMVLPVGILTNS